MLSKKIYKKNLLILFLAFSAILIFSSEAQAAPTVNVLSPNGGENFDVGQSMDITWEVSDLEEDITQGGFNLYLKDENNTAATVTIAENLDLEARSYTWEIPNIEAGFYRIQINASFLNSSNTAFYSSDKSDNLFLISTQELKKFQVDGTVFYDENGDGWHNVEEDLYISSGNYGCEESLTVEGVKVSLTYTGFAKEYLLSTCGNQDSGKFAGKGVYFQSDPISEGTTITLTLIEPEGWKSTWPDPITHTVESEYHFGFALAPDSDSVPSEPAEDTEDTTTDNEEEVIEDPEEIIEDTTDDFEAAEETIEDTQETTESTEDTEETDFSSECLLPDNSLVKLAGDPKIYVIIDCEKVWIRTFEEFTNLGFEIDDVLELNSLPGLSENALEAYEDFIEARDRLVQAVNEEKIFRIIEGKRIWVPTLDNFERQGLNWEDVEKEESSQVEQIPEAKIIKPKNGEKVYYIDQNRGTKRHLKSADVFLSYGNVWEDVVEVPRSVLDAFKETGLIKSFSGEKVYKLENGQKRWIKNIDAFNRLGLNWNNIFRVNTEELNAYSEGQPIE